MTLAESTASLLPAARRDMIQVVPCDTGLNSADLEHSLV
jgi:hypothetical protein